MAVYTTGSWVPVDYFCDYYNVRVRVRVTLRPTVSQSVSQSACLGIEPTLWTFEQIMLPFQVFGSGICCPVSVGALSDERTALSFVRIRVTLRLTVSQHVLELSPVCGRLTRYCFVFKSLSMELLFVFLLGRPLWQEVRVTLRLTVSQYVLAYCFLFKSLGLEFVVLSLWGALSDERSDL
jgi:hypothetical protein